MDKYIGSMLGGRYQIEEIVGVGGMAVVYRARDTILGRDVALKVLKKEFAEDPDIRKRFSIESRAVAKLSHHNIVSVFDVGSEDGTDYIVMELIEGITLKQYLEKKGCLNWRETLHFAMQIAKALEHAHSRGIVHRDIKPHNIMILKDGSVKVADFGIARIASKPYPDTCQFDEKSDYFDPKSTKDAPRWVAVDVEALVKFPVIPVSILRAQPELADMLILRRGNRLSITPVEKKDFLFIVEHLAKPQS